MNLSFEAFKDTKSLTLAKVIAAGSIGLGLVGCRVDAPPAPEVEFPAAWDVSGVAEIGEHGNTITDAALTIAENLYSYSSNLSPDRLQAVDAAVLAAISRNKDELPRAADVHDGDRFNILLELDEPIVADVVEIDE